MLNTLSWRGGRRPWPLPDLGQLNRDKASEGIGVGGIVANRQRGIVERRVAIEEILHGEAEREITPWTHLRVRLEANLQVRRGPAVDVGPVRIMALADMVGLDTLLAVMQVFYEGFDDSKYRPAPLLKEMVGAGYLGRKSGRGFYTYA